MNHDHLSRRDALVRTGLMLGAGLAGPVHGAVEEPRAAVPRGADPFRFCLNMATIRGQKLGIVKEVEIAAKAGYQGIEPWMESISEYAKNGGSLSDLRKRIGDLGLTVESAIGFAEWIVDDDAKRAKGIERARNEMDMIAQIGGKRVAAPPAGANNSPGLDPLKAAERYRALLEAGDQIGIVPQFELWGFSQCLHRLSECAMVAIETGHPKACILVDVFHLYKGGSDHRGLGLLSSHAVHVLHMNDYPAEPPREKINDSFRIYPGDGVAPVTDILRLLRASGGHKVLSLELFSRKYWEQDPLEVAKAGLEKMKLAAAKAMAEQ